MYRTTGRTVYQKGKEYDKRTTGKMKHYVYRLDDPITNEFYIGSRSCEI